MLLPAKGLGILVLREPPPCCGCSITSCGGHAVAPRLSWELALAVHKMGFDGGGRRTVHGL